VLHKILYVLVVVFSVLDMISAHYLDFTEIRVLFPLYLTMSFHDLILIDIYYSH
jgi:hypothetical protein